MKDWFYKALLFGVIIINCNTAEATVNLSWKSIENNLFETGNHHNGVFATVQNDTLLVSTGINGVEPYPIVESVPKNLLAHQLPKLQLFALGDKKLPNTPEPNLNTFAFSATYKHRLGTFIIGGTDGNIKSNKAKLLVLNKTSNTLEQLLLPDLPTAASSPSVVALDNFLYVLTGSDSNSRTYRLDLNSINVQDNGNIQANNGVIQFKNNTKVHWAELTSLPIRNKDFSYRNGVKLVTQYDGFERKIYALGGYFLSEAKPTKKYSKEIIIDGKIQYISGNFEVWKLTSGKSSTLSQWEYQSEISTDTTELEQPINSVLSFGKSHILAFSPNQTFSYNAITNAWAEYKLINKDLDHGRSPHTEKLQSTFWYQDKVHALVSTIKNPKNYQIWQAEIEQKTMHFGWINMSVLICYLIFVVIVGLFFVFKNKDTNDYFRGGQSIPWWAAACSIYATMLSSLTYVALPAIVYQTQWLLLIGIWMMVLVAPIAIYIAMPFFRQIDATSAYEYLSKRFNTSIRLFASGLFTLFHIGRMGIVMALTALALSAVTPLSASESVLIMGVLCLVYCTLGGIEAVIWTDTLQTIVLLIGAVICFVTIVSGIDGGLTSYIEIGLADNKFTMVDSDFSIESITTLSIWVIVLGGIGQNISSYTADQAIVQRYMVTKDPKAAAKAIWTNAIMAIPGTLLFFGIGTGLYVFYKMNPGKLDPTIQIDQIFPTFIATELPVGLAGLIVAGIFAAAQSTVSTSMNSISTTVVTDFIRPFNLVKTEKGYMSIARWLTFIMGTLGTIAGLIFIDPEIRSLMEAYFKVIGMFMGALGGLFVLGVVTKKANAAGALIGILSGVATMISAWQLGWANGYLYATIGIFSCLIIGYIASLFFDSKEKNIDGLTLYTMKRPSLIGS